MCILFIKLLKAAKPGEFKLILASNRDEFFKRPGKSAHFWEEDGNIFGGRDMTENKEGGTWLALSKKGKLGVLLNLSEEAKTDKLGRGFLVVDYLKTSLPEKEYLENLKRNAFQYNKFHLVTANFGSQPSLYHFSNGTNYGGITEIRDEVLAVGNSPLHTPFQKVINGQARFEEICKNYGKLEEKRNLLNELLSFLKWDHRHYPDALIDSLSHLPLQFKPNYSSIFVNAPEISYGTRTHTVILVDWKNRIEYHEWTLKEPIDSENLQWDETHETFSTLEGVNTQSSKDRSAAASSETKKFCCNY